MAFITLPSAHGSEGVLARRPNSALAYLCSPTDVFVVPESVWEKSVAAFEHTSLAYATLRRLAGGRIFKPNMTHHGAALPLVDSLILQVGGDEQFNGNSQGARFFGRKLLF